MANTKLSALPVATLVELTEVYMGNNPSSERVTIQDLRAFLLNEATRESVVAATTVDGALATVYENGDTLDGVTLVTADRILIKDQTAGEENGIYTVNASGPPTRALDFDIAAEVALGATVAVIGGTVQSQTWWMHTTTGAIVLETTSLTFDQVKGIGSFLSNTDTPSSFTNDSRKFARVNDAESDLEFVAEHAKEPVRCATTIAGTFASSFANGQSVDGVSLVTGDRILIKNQSAGAENGIYTVEVSGSPTRVPDLDDDTDVVIGMTVVVLQGTVNANTLWQFTTTGAITLDTTALTFVQITADPSVGKQTLWIPASAMSPTVVAGCAALATVATSTDQPDQHVLAFDTAADEHAQFDTAFPKSWNAGTITFRVFWTHQGGQTAGLDGVAWGLKAVSIADDEAFAVAYGTPIVVTDDKPNGDNLFITAESAALTIAGTPADDEMQIFDIFRDVSDGADDLNIDAQLVGMWIHFTTDASTDA